MGEVASRLPLEHGGCGSHAAVAPLACGEPHGEALRLVEYVPFPRVRLDQRWREGFTCHRWSSGMCLRAEGAAQAGSLLRIIVRDVDGRPTLDSIARIRCRCRTAEPGEARLGLSLVAERPCASDSARPSGRPCHGTTR